MLRDNVTSSLRNGLDLAMNVGPEYSGFCGTYSVARRVRTCEVLAAPIRAEHLKFSGIRQNTRSMAKQSQATKSKKLQFSAVDDSILQNKVHQLIEYIENNLRDEGRLRRSFATAALTGALKFLDEISGAE